MNENRQSGMRESVRSVKSDLSILVSMRDAILGTLKLVFKSYNVPKQEQLNKIMESCLSLSAEIWCFAHPEIKEEDAVDVFKDMAGEAVRGYFDGKVIIESKRVFKGASNEN